MAYDTEIVDPEELDQETADEDKQPPSIIPKPAAAIASAPMQPGIVPARAIPANPPLPAVPAAAPAAPAINPAMAPPPPAGGLNAVQAQNPFNVLLSQEENIHNPIARVGAKIFTHLGKGLEAMSPQYPAIEEARTKAAQEPQEEAMKAAQIEGTKADTAARRGTEARAEIPQFNPLPGENGIARDPEGNATGVIGINPGTGQLEIRPLPSAGGSQDQAAGPGGVEPGPAGPGYNVGNASPDKMRVPAAQVQSFPDDIKSGFPSLTKGQVNALKAELGPHPTQADMAKVQANAQNYSKANEAADATKVQRDQVNADRDLARGDRQKAAQEKAEEKANTVGWALDPATNEKVLTNQGEAETNGYKYFQKSTSADVEKDEAALRQMNDVQLNLSRYRQAVNGLPPEGISKEHVNAMNALLSDKDLNVRLFEGGLIPGLVTDVIQKGENARIWNKLTVPEQNSVTGYLRSKASVIAYQKALTGTGRTNKETMEVEMNNLPEPVVGATVANPRLEAFQENIDAASKGFGRIPWMEQPKDVRARIEVSKPSTQGAPQQEPNRPANVPAGYKWNSNGPKGPGWYR